MPSYYVMHRRGEFKPRTASSNQCKVEGHDNYHYHLIMAFPGSRSILDENGFIIDHAEIDAMIQRIALQGSCEEMQLKISTILNRMMDRMDIQMVACKCIISPTIPNGVAWMEFVSYSDGHQAAISCF